MIRKSVLPRNIVVVGSGPAALMAADRLSAYPGLHITLIEKRKAPGRKILIAGSSGLNITNELPVPEFSSHYRGSAPRDFWRGVLDAFSPQDWLRYIDVTLGQETFLGTSGRYFVREMKASKMLRAWLHHLAAQGVRLESSGEMVSFGSGEVQLADGRRFDADAVVLALGGASYEPEEDPLRWISSFESKGIRLEPFHSSNAGYELDWKPEFLKEAEGKPIKNCVFSTERGSKRGEVMVTRYGLEGTPVYTFGCVGDARIDLLPEFSYDEILSRCLSIKENLAPLRRAKKKLPLSEAALALLFHHAPRAMLQDLGQFARLVKAVPLKLTAVRPLTEAISSAGGVHFSEVDSETLMLKKVPGVFCAGEMLDWDAPTGGFLIQGAVSTGVKAGEAAARFALERVT